MKLFKYLVLLITVALPLACTDDLLEEVSRGNITDDSFWQSESDFLVALRGSIYDISEPFGGYSLWQYIVEDLGTDYTTGGYFATTLYTDYSDWNSTTPDFTGWGIWPQLWGSINKANTVISRLEESDLEASVRTRIKGEALAQRALAYFTLLKWFGPVPELTDPNDTRLSIPRGTIESNYDLIESDLITAADALPLKSELMSSGEAEYARLTKGSAQGLLAKAYLEQGNYTECVTVTGEIINSGEYSLSPQYMDIFSLENEGFSNMEAVWTIAFRAETNTELQTQVLHPYLYKASERTEFSAIQNWGNIAMTQSFYQSFDEADQRRNGLYLSPTDNQVMITKFPPDLSDGTGIHSGNDYYFIRYADVLLMRAEAFNELDDIGSSITELNKVRSRAGLSPLSVADFNKESLKQQIFDERRWELYLEGHIKQDTKRMFEERLLDHIRSVSSDWENVGAERYLLLPFPEQALSSNPGLEQNEGF
ncbi:MAG: RagB/SusD family nutrient uptake outer membrane protein [Bacteroidota bacterium]